MLRLSFLTLLFFLVSLLPAQRIVSLVPSVTYNLLSLEADADIVGRTTYCPGARPDQSNVVGSVIDVNIEKIVALKPDVVFAMELTSINVINSLRNLGLKVVVYPTPRSFDEICMQLEDMGKMTNRIEKAKAIVAAERKRLNEIVASVKGRASYNMFFEIGAKPLFGVLPGTYMNEYITLLGGNNILGAGKGGSVSREHVLKSRPDVIIISDMGIVGEEEARQWRVFRQLPAVKNNRIVIVDADESCCPTPHFFTKTLGVLADELFGVSKNK